MARAFLMSASPSAAGDRCCATGALPEATSTDAASAAITGILIPHSSSGRDDIARVTRWPRGGRSGLLALARPPRPRRGAGDVAAAAGAERRGACGPALE